jgi:hypothetical protein
MKTQHTPEKWYLDSTGLYVVNFPPSRGAFLKNGDKAIACSPSPYTWTEEEREMIAAAPETAAELERLKALNAEMVEAVWALKDLLFNRDHGNGAQNWSDTKDRARAIITKYAKTKGE